MDFTYNPTWPKNTTYRFTSVTIKDPVIINDTWKDNLFKSIMELLEELLENVNAYKMLYIMQSNLPDDKRQNEYYFIDQIPEEIVELEKQIEKKFNLIDHKVFAYDRQSLFMIFDFDEHFIIDKMKKWFKEAYDRYTLKFMAC